MTARRLAAILAVDVAGYSRLMGEDEAGTAKIVRERREAATPIVRAFGGRLVKTTGDGVLLEFPSVIAAVECAILIQKMMAERNAALPEGKRIRYRIGVNLGDVLIEGDDILGDGVNIAARLEGICEPGGVCVSGLAWEHVGGRIAVEFAYLGEQSLKNIAKPVRAYALPPDAIAAAKIEAPEPSSAAASPPQSSERRDPPRLSLVVLPFANIGGDSSQDYFVDGVTESLTTDLSRISGAFVIGRSTAFTYKGKAVDLKQIGRELNVRYVLEGSIQRAGARMRVNVQLIEAETGAHLWAERFDKPVGDMFDLQDEIVARLAAQLNVQLVTHEARRAQRMPSPDSMDHYFQGVAWAQKGTSPQHMARAQEFYERALALDPANIEAEVGLASMQSALAAVTAPDDMRERFAAAEAKLMQALSRAPEHAQAHLHLGVIQIHTNRAAQGVGECERALALNRNLAAAHGFIGLAKVFLGRSEETEAHVQEALRLSPRDYMAHVWVTFAGVAKLHLGLNDEALSRFRRAVEINKSFAIAHFYLAAALANLGRRDEAQAAVMAGRALDPGFAVSRWRETAPSDDPTFLAQHESILASMRLAGVPER
jgi:TolB-like protein/class 3 adenylate cyclase/tetratricopeptide (TPR) repeat protein